MMLERHFRPAFDILFGGAAETRLYALHPPLDADWPEGSAFDLRLTLIGPATRHILACTQAIAELGEEGLRPAGRYRLEAAAVIGPAGDRPYFTHADGLLAPPAVHDLREYRAAPSGVRRLRLRLATPLRLKEGNDLLRAAPRYDQIIHRLFGRIDQLAHAMDVSPPLAKPDRPPLLDEARAVRTTAADVRWTNLERRSARSGQQMNLSGLTGEIDYEGEFTQTLPWLMAGRRLHVGGKTAFGFGGVEVETIS
jgi:hypothetical protein